MINGNTTAFPSPRPINEMFPNVGLTKREYLAAEAMKSFILTKGISTWQASMNEEGMVDDIAVASVALADALLKQL